VPTTRAMKLTIENDPETVRRYGYIKPAPRLGGRRCGARCPGTTRMCTLKREHRGPHVAHGRFKRVLAVWDEETPARGSLVRLKSSLAAQKESELRQGRQGGALDRLRRGFATIWESFSDYAMLAVFFTMVGAFLYWFLLLFRVSGGR
jgi:hypothetical protein